MGRSRGPQPEPVDQAGLRGRRQLIGQLAGELRVQRCSPFRSISEDEKTRTVNDFAHATTPWKSSSRSSGVSCFESFSPASGRQR